MEGYGHILAISWIWAAHILDMGLHILDMGLHILSDTGQADGRWAMAKAVFIPFSSRTPGRHVGRGAFYKTGKGINAYRRQSAGGPRPWLAISGLIGEFWRDPTRACEFWRWAVLSGFWR